MTCTVSLVSDCVLQREHHLLGNEVTVERYSTSMKSYQDSDVVSVESFEIQSDDIDKLIIKCMCRDSSSLSERLKSLHLKVDIKPNCITCVTSSRAASSDVSKKQVVDLIHEKFSTVSVNNIPEQATIEVMHLLHSFKDEKLFEFTPEGTAFSAGGSADVMISFKDCLKEIMDKYVQTVSSIKLSGLEYEFTTQVVLEKLKTAFPNLNIVQDIDTCGLKLSGSIAKVEMFKEQLKKAIQNCKYVNVNLPSQYTSTTKGQADLKDYIKKASSQIGIYFYQNKQGEYEVNLLCRSDDLQVTKKVASDLMKFITTYSVPFSASFLLVRNELPDFLPRCDSLQSSKRLLVIPGDKLITLFGFKDDLEYAIKMLTDYIESKGKLKIDVVIGEAMYKLFNRYMTSKWNSLLDKGRQFNVKIDVNPEVHPPCASLFGDRVNVNTIMASLEQLKEAVLKHVLTVCRPGTHEYFSSDKGITYLSGIEARAKVAIEVSVAGSESEDTRDDFSSEGIKIKGETKCTGFIGRIEISVCIGDITEYNAEVIVNAANERLEHDGGVACAISKKGGQVIQEESRQHVRRFGKVDTGDVWLTTSTGNLPCKALVHAVGPTWKGGLLGEEALLYKACKASLVQSKSYHSIVFPAISSGIYGFPIDKCANTMIRATMDYAKAFSDSPLQKVIFIFLPIQARNSTAFISKLKEVLPSDKVQLTQSIPMHSIDKPAYAKPSVQMFDKSVLDKVHLRQGSLLDVQVSIIIAVYTKTNHYVCCF